MTKPFDEKATEEEKMFLSLCCWEDKQKLLQQIPMAYNDYLRISYILCSMNLIYYKVKFNELFPEFYDMKEQMLKRHRDILEEYPNYYKDEDFDKKTQDWLIEFCNQISDRQQQEKYIRMFDLEKGLSLNTNFSP